MGGGHETLTTSDEGVAFLERQEGVVLKAYRDVVGVLTIGAGLTSASGVVKVKPGMVITREEASSLLKAALNSKYEPAVRTAMPKAKQCEFDGGVSFHYNTGAISRASWVNAWLVRNWPGVHAQLMKWVKGGGKVLPGLKRRREEEFRLIYEGRYLASIANQPVRGWAAKFVPAVSNEELVEIRAAFKALGYDPGINLSFVDGSSVMRFQRDHDLTVDGVIGRATLSTLQRRLNATKATRNTVAAGVAGTGATTAVQTTDVAQLPDHSLWVLGGVVALLLIRLGWTYRDVVAAKIGRLFPNLAARLRSF